MSQENKTTYGGFKIVVLSGPWDMHKFVQTISKWGYGNDLRVLGTAHPPFHIAPILQL